MFRWKMIEHVGDMDTKHICLMGVWWDGIIFMSGKSEGRWERKMKENEKIYFKSNSLPHTNKVFCFFVFFVLFIIFLVRALFYSSGSCFGHATSVLIIATWGRGNNNKLRARRKKIFKFFLCRFFFSFFWIAIQMINQQLVKWLDTNFMCQHNNHC